MDLNIILICKWGASTGMLVEKMREAAKERGVECSINAVGESSADEVLGDADIVLLAPQARYKKDAYQAKVKVPVMVIETTDYGMLEGGKVLNAALVELAKKGGE